MKAYSLEGINKLKYIDKEIPTCPNDWSIVKVKAAGICSSDIPRILKKGTYHFPTIPGHEFSGIITNSKNPNWMGKKVGVFPLIPCKQCRQCADGKYEMCENYDYIGSRRDGGFAEYVAVPNWNLIELPQTISFVEAAMMEPLAVALHAVKKMNINPGDRVCIVGTGMIAFAAAQWAKMMKAESVFVVGRSNHKRAIAEKIEGISYKIFSEVDSEFDAVLEAVGSEEAVCKSIELVKAGGTLVLMGNPEGDIKIPQDIYWRILRKQLNVIGTWNSSYESDSKCDWLEVREALENRKIEANALVSHFFTQEKLYEGLMLMSEHREPYCKVMTIWNEENE